LLMELEVVATQQSGLTLLQMLLLLLLLLLA
jgi:hypothetical protein